MSGIVCAAGSVIYRGGGDKRLSIETENNAVARRAFRLLREVFDVQPQLVTLKRSRLGGRSAYRIEISGSEASFVLEGCGIEMGQRRGVPREITVRKCCRMSFLRGVFLACGSVTDPEKEYHLEFVLEDEAFAAALQRLIARFSLSAHLTKRRAMALVYLKGQSEITDMLSIFGAQSARFAMEDAYIRKELRNNANRAVNCDSANVQRAVTAASRQTEAIERVLAAKGRESLPPALRETAALRLAHPEMSLEELGRLCDPPVGKSGINHWLRKLDTGQIQKKRQQKDSRKEKDTLAGRGKHACRNRLYDCLKQHIIQCNPSEKRKSQTLHPKRSRSDLNYFGISFAENPDQLRGQSKANDSGDQGKDRRYSDTEPECFSDTIIPSGAVIESADWLESLTESNDGGVDEHHKTADDRHGSDCCVSVRMSHYIHDDGCNAGDPLTAK